MKTFYTIVILLTVAILIECNSGTNEKVVINSKTDSITINKSIASAIPGFNFPETESTINGWIANNDTSNIYLHGWGIWTTITQMVNSDNKSRIFETWPTIQNIIQQTQTASNLKALVQPGKHQADLHFPRQLQHIKKVGRKSAFMDFIANPDQAIVVDVRYSPEAATFAEINKIFKKSTLDQILKENKTQIPNFPNNAITLKPTYKIISKSRFQNGYYPLEVWNGPPNTTIAYPENQWNSCIYIDLKNQSNGDGSIDKGFNNQTSANSYNLDDFIHFTFDKELANSTSKSLGLQVNEGDIAILVAMHVTSREITRWTWQTFWWTPNPETPPEPSSKSIADKRPAELKGAPRHYAMSIGYSFLKGDQPLNGGTNNGISMYVYNPYLEARFGENDFNTVAIVNTNGRNIINNVGIRTNCMGCHANASYDPNPNSSGSIGYTGDTYIDMSDPRFKNQIKLDFSWSIGDNLIP